MLWVLIRIASVSTHNIGFYEEISKIIPLLSSNITKYTPYLVFCSSDNINEKDDGQYHSFGYQSFINDPVMPRAKRATETIL